MSVVEPPNWSHAQSKSAAMSRLIWRDTQMIRTLVLAGIGGTIAFNLISIILWFVYGGHADSLMGICSTWLVVIPCFVAFGAPAMLVGTEEESGTLNWIRTLPVSWQQFAASKLLVAAGGVAINWGVALIVAAFVGLLAANREMMKELGELPWTAFVAIPLWCACISMLLLLLGFTMGYLVRSPLLGILCSGALFILSMIGISLVDYGLHSVLSQLSDTQSASIASVVAVLFLVALWAVQRQLARRRLLSPDPEFAAKFKSAISSKEVYPQASPRIPSGERPSQVASLLWQQTRQMGPACVLLLFAAQFCSLPFLLFSESQIDRGGLSFLAVLARMAPMLSFLACCWLGVLTFYGDNVHRRCGFFADRGISPSRIWWTRVLLPSVACVFLIGMFYFFTSMNGSSNYSRVLLPILVSFSVAFAFGQLVSQWMRRPVLAFFAAPAFMPFGMMPVMALVEKFEAHYSIFLLLVPGLLFVTWRLTGLWLEDREGKRYNLQAAAYTIAVVAVPCLCSVIWPVLRHNLVHLSVAFSGVTP